ncbi:hypothetical protein Ae201684_009886 [Aphanomyces euteiches]|uniref:HTH CENPB-type domain-containing protein n=1 Tax=Aphanomyces euteiches TaxID=100861 RepID=A0A6G0WZV5_9STRA|nr:hypothetical protein Ae201684_009886 [Aphanomyces euteiches]KAH9154747.1 hypothetical protein AeRB84_003208 [Aphanomyces euteiches]
MEPVNDEASATVEGTTRHEKSKSHKRPRRETSLVEKLQLIHRADSGSISQRKLAKDFNIGLGTVNNILKKKAATLLEAHEGQRPASTRKKPRHALVDQLVFDWMKSVKGPLNGNMVKDKALELAKRLPSAEQFKASNGWLESFCKRHSISFRKMRKESSVPTSAPLDLINDNGFEEWTQWFASMSSVLSLYTPNDIYSCSETQLLYQTLPDTAARLLRELKTHNLSLHEETEVSTLLLCCNMSGTDKLPPLIIGSDQNSTLPDELGFKKAPQAWMTADIFHEWLLAFDSSVKRKVILILPTTPCHSSDLDLENVSLRVCPSYLPSQMSPLLHGVIGQFKEAYRCLLLRHVLTIAHLKKGLAQETTVDSLQLHAWVVSAWATVSPSHCQASFGRQPTSVTPASELNSLLALYHVLFPVSDPTLMLATADYVSFDDHLPTQLMFTEDFLTREEPSQATTTQLTDAKVYDILDELREYAMAKEPSLVASITQAKMVLEQRTTEGLIQSIGLQPYTWE